MIPAKQDPRITEAMRIMQDFWKPEQFPELLSSAHPQLDGRSILQAIHEGDIDQVLLAMKRLEEGVYL